MLRGLDHFLGVRRVLKDILGVGGLLTPFWGWMSLCPLFGGEGVVVDVSPVSFRVCIFHNKNAGILNFKLY